MPRIRPHSIPSSERPAIVDEQKPIYEANRHTEGKTKEMGLARDVIKELERVLAAEGHGSTERVGCRVSNGRSIE
jgi:hypothetical protein